MTTAAALPMQGRLRAALVDFDFQDAASARLRELIRQRLDQLPLPGSGATMQRWEALAAVAEHDLSLAKLYEGHTDALAILTELGEPAATDDGGTWGSKYSVNPLLP